MKGTTYGMLYLYHWKRLQWGANWFVRLNTILTEILRHIQCPLLPNPYSQYEGIDNIEVFFFSCSEDGYHCNSPYSSCLQQWYLYQLYVNNAFLHSDLEYVYMQMLSSFQVANPFIFLKLSELIYNLKHSLHGDF